MTGGLDAVVVGAGPNGLAAAITLAGAGWAVHVVEAEEAIGGGCRTGELTLPGYRHDICSTVHALAPVSPFLRSLDLTRYGVEWVRSPAALAHAFPDRPAALVESDLDATASRLGRDGAAYRRLLRRVVRHPETLGAEVLAPLVHLPRHPWFLARFGLDAMQPATLLARRFATPEARALIAGAVAHSTAPLGQPLTAAFALVMLGSAHIGGWPVARGGSQSVTDALAARLGELGGSIETGRVVRRMSELPRARAYLFDVSPEQLSAICADDLPRRYLRALARFRRGPGVFKLDYALDGPIPWRDPACLRAATVHVGASFEEMAAAEADVNRSRVPDRPFLIVVQASLVDPTRAPSGQHTAWVYCHVPNGCTVDMTERIERRLEVFAPGFRDRILARHVLDPAGVAVHNRNNVGGDIAGGRNSVGQLVFRPVPRLASYATPNPSVFLCSSSTPPGGGVHGMCGHLAARVALRRHGRGRLSSPPPPTPPGGDRGRTPTSG